MSDLPFATSAATGAAAGEYTWVRLISLKRGFSDREDWIMSQGRDELGGKAQGLLFIRQALAELDPADRDGIKVDIPSMTIIGTSVFDAFIERNNLDKTALSEQADTRIARAFLRADLPFEILGELRRLIQRVKTPLAVRSSGLLEDTTHRPFAGVYSTKMIPNNQLDPEVRLNQLIEAVKFIWASTFFKTAKDYCRATGLNIQSEKMAVIIQEMVGARHDDRFYPELSGVARSYNFYPVKPARPEDGVVDLALGLGKTIVDGDKTWTYSPAYPQAPPPFNSIEHLLEETQTQMWVVNLGEPPEYNPLKETEYMRRENLTLAEKDGTLRYLASTFDPQSERLATGTGEKGARVLTFAPLLVVNEIPVNRLVSALLTKCQCLLGAPVEIEFAMTFKPPFLGFLQVRSMVVPNGDQHVAVGEVDSECVLAASESVLGNGTRADIADVVYVKPEGFQQEYTKQIATELESINNQLLDAGRPYLLIVFGRLGSFDPWLGIPVSWGQICGAKVIIEATKENFRVELSQGSHYFHNIINLGVFYFSMPFSAAHPIDWDWLNQQNVEQETGFVRHVRLTNKLVVKVDGRNGKGVILKTITEQ
jgi:hypothetical protein